MNKITHWRAKLLGTAAYGMFVTLLGVFHIPCIFLTLTGRSCAGCGMTRAWLSVLRLDFAAAFAYHPLFWSVPILYAYVLWDGHPFPHYRINRWVLILLLTALGALGAVRLFVN